MSDISLLDIRIEGFRAFQQTFEASFRSPAGTPIDRVVIAGPNGTGKTALLEAILLALGREVSIRRTLAPEATDNHWRAAIPEAATITLTMAVSSAPGTALGTLAPCEVQIERSATHWQLTAIKDGKSFPLPDAVRTSFLERLAIDYISSWRGSFQLGGLRASASLSDIPTDERYRLRRLKQRIIDERAAGGFSGRETRDTVWLDKLNEVWRDWHDGGETWIDARETGDTDRPFDLFVMRDDAMFGPQPLFPLDMASSGELEWFTLAGTLIVEEFKGLLLIDEPELHLHPQWQARLLPTLRKLIPEAQLIVATHSAYPWDQALPYQRLLLLPPGDPRHMARPEDVEP